ncbi:hypothetical protein O0I10_011773 [Lichtheimia ornata]|uniref:TM7S3/TM198-like domain-containing protein n=1 Tax=Lichtheimia ornata TaxID=688661 RepID=A0AAD7XTR1_9FUNG|nr:uncharacterized protein O0I10_011773 [Lichtheimia ornata]KAJ8652568.1 hypothetical protein O0I10_011773 [Lichtheimia ornata]
MTRGCMLLLLLVACTVIGAPVVVNDEPGVLYLPNNAIVLDDGYQLSIQGVIGSIVLIGTALLLWLRGAFYYFQTPATSGLVGFITLGLITWVLLANLEPAGTYGTNRWTLYLVAPIGCGLAGALILACCAWTPIPLMVLGGLGGLAAGLWVLGWRTGTSIQSNWGRAVLLVVLVILGCLIAALDYLFHMLGTSMIGAYMLMLGLDVYFHTGFTYCFTATLDQNPAHGNTYTVTRETNIIQGVLVVAVLVGLVIQLCMAQSIQSQHTRAFSGLYQYPVIRHVMPQATLVQGRWFTPWQSKV